MVDSGSEEVSTRRTKTACEVCRRKKIKCSGGNPCTHCQQLKNPDCIYIEKVRKRRPDSSRVNKRNESSKNIQMMENRLSRLEGFILNISNKLDNIGGTNPVNATKVSSAGKDIRTDDEDDDLKTEDGNESSSLKTPSVDDHSLGNPNDEKYHATVDRFELLARISDLNMIRNIEKSKENESYMVYSMKEEFFESHSFLSVCSSKSMDWILKSLDPSKHKSLETLTRFPYFFFLRAKTLIMKWVDTPIVGPEDKVKLLEKPLPDDKEYILEVWKESKDLIFFVEYTILSDTIQELLDLYYSNQKLSSSQLLLVCSFVYLLFSGKMDQMLLGNLGYSALSKKYTEKQLLEFQDHLGNSSVIFFNRVSVFGQGLQTIQAILLLIYAITGHGVPDMDYSLLAIAIKHAKDLGLHLPDSYSMLAPEEADARKRLWVICQELDIELSFRHGKPPILNADDVRKCSLDQIVYILEKLGNYKVPPYFKSRDMSNLEAVFELGPIINQDCYLSKNYRAITYYLGDLVSRLRSKSYSKLFLVLGRKDVDIEYVLDELNNDAFIISNIMTNEFAPRFYDDPKFAHRLTSHDPIVRSYLLKVHSAYFVHLLLVNRVPFMVNSNINNFKSTTYRKIHLRSARTLIHLALKFGDVTDAFIVNWMSLYPFVGFLMLLSNCMNFPNHEDLKLDLALLEQFCNTFFNERYLILRRVSYTCVIMIAMKVFIEIVVGMVESGSGQKYEFSKTHEQQIVILRKYAPELFGSMKGFKGFKVVINSDSKGSENSAEPYMKTTAKHEHSGVSYYQTHPDASDFGTPMSNPQHNTSGGQQFETNYPSTASSGSPNFIGGYDFGDDSLAAMVSNLMNQLPNFFFDNNLGL